jgi:hypothetical protein
VDLLAAEEASRLALSIDDRLQPWARDGWRWRILYLRAVLERQRLTPDGLHTPEARAAMTELIEIFHARLHDDGSDPYHSRVRPPLA